MNLPNMEVPAAVKEAMEQGAQRAQEACVEAQKAAEQATSILETTAKTASDAALSLQAQAMDALKVNMANGFDFANKLLSCKSPTDAIEHCTAFARQQMELAMSQSKSAQDLGAKVAADVAQPAKDGLKIVFNQANKQANKVA